MASTFTILQQGKIEYPFKIGITVNFSGEVTRAEQKVNWTTSDGMTGKIFIDTDTSVYYEITVNPNNSVSIMFGNSKISYMKGHDEAECCNSYITYDVINGNWSESIEEASFDTNGTINIEYYGESC